MRRAYLSLVALFLTGCPNPFAPACTAELGMVFAPPAPTLAVGQSITASLELTSCGGRERWRPNVSWRTEDTEVVSVEATGRITALAVGDATVYAVEAAGTSNESRFPYFVKVR